jgi:cyclic beta-1,2-glucan synthetase
MHRAAIESMFGLTQHGTALSFTPCLPSHWPEVELTLRRGDASVRVILARSDASRQWKAAEKAGALRIASGELLEWDRLAQGGTALLRLDAALRPQAGAAASYSLQGGAPMSR